MNARSVLEFSPGAAGPVFPAAGSPRDWRDLARCAEIDPDLFFPEQGGPSAQAGRVCAGCEVRAECLEFAVGHGIRFGIWGGLSEAQRRPLIRARLRAKEAPLAEAKARLDERARRRHPDGRKRCSRCGAVKDIAAFGYASANADGLAYWCAQCRALERARLGRAA